MSKLRTFIAVEPTAAIRAAASDLIDSLAGTPANVKWVEKENLHWTLKFLGDVHGNEIPRVCDVVAEAVLGISSFDIQANGAGAFPNAERPRTLWLGVAQGELPFVALHDVVENALEPLGFRTERRRFYPHLTIGRVRRSPFGIEQLGERIAEHIDFAAGTMRVRELVVFASRLRREGPSYQPLGRIPLA